MCLLVSITRASPTVWPHCEVPAPRGSTGTPSSRAMSSARLDVVGAARDHHPIGSIWIDARHRLRSARG
jgi:hypothetical protein